MKKYIFGMLVLLMGAMPPFASAGQADAGQLAKLAERAYVFGYPLLLMDATRQAMTAPEKPGGPPAINRFSHIRAFPDHTFTDVVSPNADTLYSIAWLDLKDTPVALELPEMGDRYYVMQFLDAWTNDFQSLGSRTSGNRPGTYLICGPGWHGETPKGMVRVDAPTSMVWILGRTQTNGKDDYAAVHAVQDSYRLTPLRADAVVPPAAPKKSASPLEQVEGMEAAAFFAAFNRLMQNNPPAPADAPLLEELAALGIAPGKALDAASLPQVIADALESGRKAGLAAIRKLTVQSFGAASGGWSVLPANTGKYGTDYLLRAFTARFGLGANLCDDAVYPATDVDADGSPLNGANRYTIRFAPGQLPPVHAFWSVSLYDSNQRFVDNPINRYAIGDRDPLVPDADGGLTLYLQHASPGQAKEANWLPAPQGGFNLIMRLYWPATAILDGNWPLPEVRRAEK